MYDYSSATLVELHDVIRSVHFGTEYVCWKRRLKKTQIIDILRKIKKTACPPPTQALILTSCN